MRAVRRKLMCLVLASSSAAYPGQLLVADDTPNAEMTDLGGGVLKQAATGLEWAQADNGSDINWAAAGRFCASKGDGWRLPSVAELQSLYDKTGKLESNCGSGFTCKVSPLFRLTGPWAWTNEPSTSMSSWIVILTKGNTYTFVADDAARKRALCVSTPTL